MSRKLHLATTGRDTERGLSNTPGTGTPRRDVTVPKRNTKTSTAQNEDLEEIEEDEEKIKEGKAEKAKPKGAK